MVQLHGSGAWSAWRAWGTHRFFGEGSDDDDGRDDDSVGGWSSGERGQAGVMRRLVLGVTLEGDERVRVSSDMVNRVDSVEQPRRGGSLEKCRGPLCSNWVREQLFVYPPIDCIGLSIIVPTDFF